MTDHQRDEPAPSAGPKSTRLIKSFGSFVLGLFANQIANSLEWPASFTLLIVFAFFCIAYVVESPPSKLREGANPQAATSLASEVTHRVELLFRNALTTALAGVLIGSVTATASVLPILPAHHFDIEVVGYSLWNYEILCFVINSALLLFVLHIKTDAVIRLAAAISIGLGSAASILLIGPGRNTALPTIASWILMLLISLFLLRYVGLIVSGQAIRRVRDALTKTRE